MWRNNKFLYTQIKKFNDTYPTFVFEDIFKFCTNLGINVIPYNQYNELYQISRDGFTYYDNKEYSIFYNESRPYNRIRFTIAHELGHIFLNHHNLVSVNMLAKKDYYYNPIWEQQANVFARNILLPADIAKGLKNYSHQEISNTFELSIQMVDLRYKTLQQDICYLKNINYI